MSRRHVTKGKRCMEWSRVQTAGIDKHTAEGRHQTVDSRQRTANSRQQTADSTADSRQTVP
jgi:hypothetical protein